MNVAVNFLIGTPFYEGAKATIDFNARCLRCLNLQGQPSVPLIFPQPQLDNQNLSFSRAVGADRSAFSIMHSTIDEILAYFCAKSTDFPTSKRTHVQFFESGAMEFGQYGPTQRPTTFNLPPQVPEP